MAETVFGVTQSVADLPPARVVADAHALEQDQIYRAAGATGDRTILISSGLPIDGIRVKVVRENREAKPGEIGSIWVTGKFLFSGYFRDWKATSDALINEWYDTGDLGFLHQEQLFITGRMKDTIIINGKNLYAHDIEAEVSSVSGVKPGRSVALGFLQ